MLTNAHECFQKTKKRKYDDAGYSESEYLKSAKKGKKKDYSENRKNKRGEQE